MIARLPNDAALHSDAMNFMSFTQAGVDPRTGQYTIRLDLPALKANDLRDIDFPLVLAFTPLANLDRGYGLGWNLQLSQFNPNDNMLTLHTGESFLVTGENSGNQRLVMLEQKLQSFHAYRVGNDSYRIVHRSGLVELLEMRGSGTGRRAMPVLVASPLGHSLTLEYKPFGNGYEHLETIRQADGLPVFDISLADSLVTLAYNPMATNGPTATYKLHTPNTEKRVERIELPSSDKAGWTFEYRKVRDLWCVDHVTTPAGATEKLFYDDNGHLFPGNQYPALPRVTSHQVTPQSGGQTVDYRYTYPNDPSNPVLHNFLGYGLNISWTEAPGRDALYQYIGEYSYGSVVAVHVQGSATPLRTTERRYNQLHLLTLEKVTQGDNVLQTVTEYDLDPSKPFAEQRSTCQLPTHSKRTWWHKTQSSLQRTETETRTYDEQGNLESLEKPNQVKEFNVWWPASGAEEHPADPEGFVRHLKSKTITPAPHEGMGSKAATLVQRYEYMTLPALALGKLSLNPCHLLFSETLSEIVGDQETELERTEYTHTDKVDVPLRHGRVQMRTATRANTFTITTYTVEKPEALGILKTQETTIGFDGKTATVARHEALLTGHVTWRQNADGVQSEFEYDALGRPLSETVAPGTEYEAKRTWQYFLNANTLLTDASPPAAEAPGQAATDEHGITTRTYIDGLGRTTRSARDKVDEQQPSALFEQYKARYDGLGNLVEETEIDLLGDRLDAEKRTLTTTHSYDDWGQRNCTTGPDGVAHYEQTDPIGGTTAKGPVITRWNKSAQGDKVSGHSRTFMNLFEKPTQVERLDASGKVLAATSNRYDGLGRCIEAVDERHNKTVYTYDARDRVLSSTLPDSTKLEYAYATHSSENHPVALTVTPMGKTKEKKTIINQTFDGLLRLATREVGARLETYQYESTHTRPSSLTTPSGTPIAFDYAINLSPLPTLNDAPDDKATFAYHPISAALRTATNAEGTRSFDYNLSNQLISETWAPAGTDKSWVTRHDSSLAGLQLKRTDPGQQTLVHSYDAQARLQTTRQGQVQATFEYDNLGRLESTTTQNLASGGATSVTRLAYDDQDREITRHEKVGNLPERVLVQAWGDDDLLKERTLSENGVALLHEKFAYDPRMRLTEHECEGSQLPLDPLGRPYTKVIMSLDGYDNVTLSTYTIKGITGPQRVVYSYAENDPCQLVKIQYVGSQPGTQAFTYDADGNLEKDEQNNTLKYDLQGRLLTVTGASAAPLASYRYDASGDLHTREAAGQAPQMLFFEADRLALAIHDALAEGASTQLLYAGEQPLAQQSIGDASQTLLLQSNMSGSVLAEYRGASLQSRTYAAYGAQAEPQPGQGLLAFNGELREPGTGWYLLGRGYRAYNPGLMRFHSPDALCALDEGGSLNPYVYCNGNPITLRDPTGHSAEGYATGRLRRPDEDNPLALGGTQPRETGGGGPGWGFWLGIGLSLIGLIVPVAGLAYAAIATTTAITATMIATTAATTVLSAVSIGTGVAAAYKQDQGLETASNITGALAFILGLGSSLFSAAGKAATAAGAASRSGSVASAVSRAGSMSSTATQASSLGRASQVSNTIRTMTRSQPSKFAFHPMRINRSMNPRLVIIANRTMPADKLPGALASRMLSQVPGYRSLAPVNSASPATRFS
ncbi:RHS repeat domain-containing protein [Pantoea sp. Tr-811]|uniref:RHS repeat domain-containing protein n=1 Tax=Pantoea sp. Tr-811 TaxID=2608361 RepID=UPI0014225308|nr:RHS repeat-associated core domain-containing protein [Pantoea sp. Tr-811]